MMPRSLVAEVVGDPGRVPAVDLQIRPADSQMMLVASMEADRQMLLYAGLPATASSQ
jgi:hypothetical protein